MDINKIKSTLKAINKELSTTYKAAASAAETEIRARLRPGDNVPQIQYANWPANVQKSFAASVAELNARAMKTLDGAIEDAKQVRAEPPSTDAVNSVTMLRGKSTVTREELEALLAAYGDNYLTYTALADLAAQHKLERYVPHMIEGIQEGLEELRRIYQRDLTSYGAAHAVSTDGRASLMDATVDMNLPG